MNSVQLDPVLDIITQRENAAAAEAAGANALGREEFLKLLIAQLENQDPMQPAQDTEFVAQLATFSSLEQLITANDNLELLSLGQANLINSQVLNLIGKEALMESDGQIRIVQGAPEQIVYALPRAAQEATLTIYGPDGIPVRVLELEKTPSGRVTVDWDGLDDEGEPLSDGEYRFAVQARDLDGSPMSVAVFESLPIDGVTFADTGITLVSGDREIPFELIMEIRSAQPSG